MKLNRWNIFGVLIITVFIFSVSIFSIASKEQAVEWRLHWVSFFFTRLAILMSMAAGLTAIVAAFNALYQLLAFQKIYWKQIVPVIILALSVSLLTSVIGTCILLFA